MLEKSRDQLRRISAAWPRIRGLLNTSLLQSARYYVGLNIIDSPRPSYMVLKVKGRQALLWDCGLLSDLPGQLDSIRKYLKHVAVPVPRDQIIFRVVDLNVKPGSVLNDQVHELVLGVIPFDIGDVYYRYVVLEQNDDFVRIALAVIKKDKIYDYQDYFKQLGLKKVDLTVSPISLLNAYFFHYREQLLEEAFCFVDLSLERVEISVLNAGQLIFSKSVQYGVGYLLRMIEQSKGVSADQAEAVLEKEINTGGEIISEWSNHVLKEINLAVKYASAKHSVVIKRFVVSGYPLNISDDLNYLVDRMRVFFNATVEHLTPLKNLMVDPKSPLNTSAIPEDLLLLPLGAAAQESSLGQYSLNFFPLQQVSSFESIIQKSNGVKKHLKKICIAVVLLVGIVQVKLVLNTRQIYLDLEKQQRKKLEQVNQMKKVYASKEQLKNLPFWQYSFFRMLQGLTQVAVDKQVSLVHYEDKGMRIVLEGYAQDDVQLQLFLDELVARKYRAHVTDKSLKEDYGLMKFKVEVDARV